MKIFASRIRINRKSYVVAIMSVLLLASCADDNRVISISGTTKDPTLNNVLENVDVTLYSQKTTTGTFSYNFVKEASTKSNAQGEFSFDFTFSYNVAFKLELGKDAYFSSVDIFDLENIPDDDRYFKEFEMYPEAKIRFHLVNQNPFNAADNVQYRVTGWDYDCDGCCPYIFRKFTGANIDEIFECRVYGNKQYEIEFIVTKNGNSSFPKRIANCTAFTTQDVELIF